jgi:hypothetical protein
MFLSAVSVLVVVQLSSEVPEGLMNNPVLFYSILDLLDYSGVCRARVYNLAILKSPLRIIVLNT